MIRIQTSKMTEINGVMMIDGRELALGTFVTVVHWRQNRLQ